LPTDEEDRANLTYLDALTGCPRPDDVLVFAIPVCGPVSALNGYKYKCKLIPGTTRKGRASKQAVMTFQTSKVGRSRFSFEKSTRGRVLSWRSFGVLSWRSFGVLSWRHFGVLPCTRVHDGGGDRAVVSSGVLARVCARMRPPVRVCLLRTLQLWVARAWFSPTTIQNEGLLTCREGPNQTNQRDGRRGKHPWQSQGDGRQGRLGPATQFNSSVFLSQLNHYNASHCVKSLAKSRCWVERSATSGRVVGNYGADVPLEHATESVGWWVQCRIKKWALLCQPS
jgi:hypothetical protein